MVSEAARPIFSMGDLPTVVSPKLNAIRAGTHTQSSARVEARLLAHERQAPPVT